MCVEFMHCTMFTAIIVCWLITTLNQNMWTAHNISELIEIQLSRYLIHLKKYIILGLKVTSSGLLQYVHYIKILHLCIL